MDGTRSSMSAATQPRNGRTSPFTLRSTTAIAAARHGAKTLVVEQGDAGYADLAVMDGTVYVLYEQRFGEVVRLARFPLDELFHSEK